MEEVCSFNIAYVDFAGVDFGDDDDVACRPGGGSDDDDDVRDERLEILRRHREEASAVGSGGGDGAGRRSVDMPDGQCPLAPPNLSHDPILFAAQSRRVDNLCAWYELGVRPSLSSSSLLNLAAHGGRDDDLLASGDDDLSALLLRSVEAQDDLNANLPPFPRGEHEDALRVAPSTIKGAGRGLFATESIRKGAVVCHYSGYRHHYQSQKRLKDRSYVLKLQNGWPKHDRRNDGFVDALPTTEVLARYMNDPRKEDECNVKFMHVQEPGIWHCPVVALRDIEAGEELFVSYGPRYWSESRMIGD